MTQKKRIKRSPFRFNEMWIYGAILLALLGLLFWGGSVDVNKTVSWNEFQTIARTGALEEIEVNRSEYTLTATVKDNLPDSVLRWGLPKDKLAKSQKRTISTQIPSVDKFADFYEQSGLQTKVTYTQSDRWMSSLLINIIPFIFIIAFWIFMMRRMNGAGGSGGAGGVFNVGKSKAQLHDKSTMSVTFDDVAGLHEAKVEVEEIVHFLKHPEKYTQLGGKIPKGALLVGPPGTGKTLLAKAVAGEAHVPFFSLSGSDFVEMFVGVGASRVRDLFQQAKQKAPCIIFIDEIDAVGRARGKNNNLGGGNDERENTLNQLLTEMDGFGTNSGIIILAATNRADILDSALLRAGRFDRQIYVDLPDINDRKEIFMVHLKSIKTDSSLDIDLLARQTPGFSGADIANICNEAALIAARGNKEFVSKDDFMSAVDRVVGGLEKKNKITTAEERRSIAIHEAGHATVSWFLEYANPLVKVTIVPRGKALGAAWYLPEERQITPTQALLDQMCATLGGRAAEEVFLGRISTGASNDLERVTQLAYAMVTYYGMSEKVPNVNYYELQNQGYGLAKPYSEKTAELIDQEVQAIISGQYERAKALLRQYADGHAELSNLLLEAEVIYTEDVERIFGKRQWASRTEEIIGQAETNSTAQSELSQPNQSTSDIETENGTEEALQPRQYNDAQPNTELTEGRTESPQQPEQASNNHSDADSPQQD